MNVNNENISVNEFEEQTSHEGSTSKKQIFFNILLFICCVVISFAIWSYANYAKDPMVEKGYYVEYVLVDGAPYEYISPKYGYITFYGTQSALDAIAVDSDGFITININRSSFDEYDVYVPIDIANGKNYHIHKEIELKLSINTIIGNE